MLIETSETSEAPHVMQTMTKSTKFVVALPI